MLLLRKPAAAKKLGLAINSFDDLRRRDATFPKAVLLGARAVGFVEGELDDWIASRPRVGASDQVDQPHIEPSPAAVPGAVNAGAAGWGQALASATQGRPVPPTRRSA